MLIKNEELFKLARMFLVKEEQISKMFLKMQPIA